MAYPSDVTQIYRNPPQASTLFNGTRNSIVQAAHSVVNNKRLVLDQIVETFTPETATFEGVIEAIARSDDYATIQERVLQLYFSVSTDPEIRRASRDARKIFSDFSTESKTRKDVFALVEALYRKRESLRLDTESLPYLEKLRRSFIIHGVGLPVSPDRDRFIEIEKQLAILRIEFTRNVNENNGGLWLSKEELADMPHDILSNLKTCDTGEHQGKLWLTLRYTHIRPAMRFVKNGETRKRLYIANENKCPQNSSLFKETIVLRDEKARLLGYKNHTAMALEDKITKDPANVNRFLEELRPCLMDAGRKELDRLRNLKAEDFKKRNLAPEEDFYLWDLVYYRTMLVNEQYYIDDLEIANYFPLDTTVPEMLKTFEELIGLVFVRVDGPELGRLSSTGRAEDVVFHADNIVHSVWNDESEGNGFVGYLYMDLHPREAKYDHVKCSIVQQGFTHRDGTRHYPAVALICNYTLPTPDKPSLLRHAELVTLFHELGHAMHVLVSKTTFSKFHGTATVRDFVETPSQMPENWTWTPGVIKRLSRHYETNAQMPDDLVERLVASKNANAAMSDLDDLFISLFDMKCHSPDAHEDVLALNTTALWNETRASIKMLAGPESYGQGSEWGHGEGIFDHLMIAYSAGYYGYLLGKAHSLDMFHTFFKDNPMDGQEGRRYRHTVLEPGASRDESETLRLYLGREPNLKAYYEELGLAASD